MANVLVISTSFRKNSNSDILSDEFIKGAAEAGHNVEKINLSDKTILQCKRTIKNTYRQIKSALLCRL